VNDSNYISDVEVVEQNGLSGSNVSLGERKRHLLETGSSVVRNVRELVVVKQSLSSEDDKGALWARNATWNLERNRIWKVLGVEAGNKSRGSDVGKRVGVSVL
jgi:hypothetical protein